MFRTAVNCVLIALLVIGAIPLSAAEPTVAEQVAKLKVGRKIKVELTSGETLKGRMGPATADQFALEPRSAAQGTARVVQFSEARAVKPDGLTKGEKWAIFGVIWVAVGIAAKLTSMRRPRPSSIFLVFRVRKDRLRPDIWLIRPGGGAGPGRAQRVHRQSLDGRQRLAHSC